MKWLGFIGLLILFSNAQAKLTYEQDFEKGLAVEERLQYNLDNGIKKPVKIVCGSIGERFIVQDKVKRYGKYAALMMNEGERRCEFVAQTFESGHFRWNEDHWSGFSFNIPYTGKGFALYHQHHSSLSAQGKEDVCQYNGNGFTIHRQNNREGTGYDLAINLRPAASLNLDQKIGSATSGSETVYRWPLKLNEWNDIVINFRYSDKSDAFFKIWHNGKLVVDISGTPNVTLKDSAYRPGNRMYPSKGACRNPIPRKYYSQYGLYNGTGGSGAVYYDEVRIGDANSSYEEVAPGGKRPITNFILKAPVAEPTPVSVASPPVPSRGQVQQAPPLNVPAGLELEINKATN